MSTNLPRPNRLTCLLAIACLGTVACGADDGAAIDTNVHFTQEGDPAILVSASYHRNPGEPNYVFVRIYDAEAEYITDATVTAGPPGDEVPLALNSEGHFVVSFTGEFPLLRVHAEWDSGSADMVAPVPTTVTISPQPLARDQPIMVSWPAWRSDRSTHVDIDAGMPNTTLHYSGIETDLSVTSHVVPGSYLPLGNKPFEVDVAFNGEFRPTGGVGGERSPKLSMRYEHAFEFEIP